MSRAKKNRKNNMRGNNLSVRPIEIKNDAQKTALKRWIDGYNLILKGTAGTGKTFLALNFALNDILSGLSDCRKVIIVRSVVPTRDMGFLPGDAKEKTAMYEGPYSALCSELIGRGDAYQILKQKGLVEFMSTSFIRGITLDNCIIIVDECQNMSFQELDSIITRVGINSKIIFAGDTRQDDLSLTRENSGMNDFMKIMRGMPEMRTVNFGPDDIVRSDMIKSYILEKDRLNL